MSRSAQELRRGIGYVIQQVGLFPHRTIASNIATKPAMLGWEKSRCAARVEELPTRSSPGSTTCSVRRRSVRNAPSV